MKLSNGFEVDIREDALDDWDVFKNLCDVDKGSFSSMPQLLNDILGEENVVKLEDHLKETTGRVKASDMMTALSEIIENLKETNSKK